MRTVLLVALVAVVAFLAAGAGATWGPGLLGRATATPDARVELRVARCQDAMARRRNAEQAKSMASTASGRFEAWQAFDRAEDDIKSYC